MSWIKEHTLNWFQFLALKIMRTGRVPRHVAFIMDGNRRYANKKHVAKVEGHTKGYVFFIKILKYTCESNLSCLIFHSILLTTGLIN